MWRQSVLLLVVLWLSVDYSQGQTVNACAGMLGGIRCDGSGQSCVYTASYVVEPDDTVTFTASATTTGWVAIGVFGDQFMPITDVVLGAADGSNSFIHDRFASARAEPPIDASQDITSASASLVDGVTTITFNRPRDSGDSNDITLRQDPCRFFLFAFSGSVNFATQAAGYHGGTNRAASAERICIPTFAECSAVDPPVLNVQPVDQTDVDPGTNVNFTVMAVGSDLTYQWQRDMSDITDDGGEYAGTATSVLTVLDAREGDEGGYRCRVMNAVGSEFSAAAQLTVLDPPTITDQPTALTSVTRGDNVTFSVVADGERLSYSWLFQGAELLSNDTVIGVNTSELMIFDVHDAVMGNYQCVVSNAAGSVSSDIVQLALVGRPVILENPMNAAVENGSNVDFTCTATSNASLTFLWRTTASGVTLPNDVEDGSDPAAGVTSTLSLTAVTVSHRGDYICDVENARGNKLSIPATLTVVVIDDVMPPTQTVGFGVNATFTCSASGSPNLEYSWESLDVIFPETGSTLVGTDTANLIVTNVGPRVNESRYRCNVGINGMQISSREAELITFAPVFVMELPDGPIIISSGDMLMLMCTAMNTLDSPNNLQFIWYFDNIRIPEAMIVSSEEDSNRMATSTLTIDSVNRSNDGQYTCRAYNRLISEGIDSITNVTVEVLPVILDFPMGIERRNAGSNLMLSCRAEGLPPIGSIENLRNNVSVNSTTGDSVTFDQENLQLNDSGTTYACRAVNTRGNITVQSFELIVQAAPGEMNHSVVTFELTGFFSARLTWPEPETNNGPITQYTVSYCQTIDSMTCGTPPDERNVSNRSIELIDLVPRKTYQVTIRAENGAGEGPVPVLPSNETFMFNSTNEDDVSPINLTAAIVTESLIALSWEVPAIALNTPEVTVDMFNVSYKESGSDVINSMIVPGNSLAMVVMGLESDRDYAISVVVVYTYSAVTLESSPAERDDRTLAEDVTPAPPTVDEETPDNMITIRWPRPSGFEFLEQYIVTLSQQRRLSLRKRRQTSTMMITVPPVMTSYQFQADPFTQYTADVSGDFFVSGVTFNAPVTGLMTFNSNEQEPSGPRNLAVVMIDFRALDLRWQLPADPNGIITSFTVSYTSGNVVETVPANDIDSPFEHRLTGLIPNTLYTIRVAAINGAGVGTFSDPVSTRTDLGVVKPVILSFDQVDNQPRIRMTIGPFSNEQGELRHYKIVVGIAPAPVPGTIADSTLGPFDEESALSYYVAAAFDVTDFRSPFIIGDGSSSTFDGRTFTNPELSVGSVYYAFIRLYSAQVATLSEDSDILLAVTLVTATTSDNTAVIVGGVVGVVALVVTGIIVVSVLVLRYWSRNRQAEYSIKQNESYESIELSALARSGDANIDVKENVAYSVHMQHPRGSLPSAPVIVGLQAEGMVPQESAHVYDFIPGEPQPSATDIHEIMNPCGNDKPPETIYDEISHEESR